MATDPKLAVEDLCVSFGPAVALKHISLQVFPRERLAIIGPAGGGKTTFLRSLNRLNDLEPAFTRTGRVLLDGQDIYAPSTDVAALRRRVGMVYAVPVPLPWSIYDNVIARKLSCGNKTEAGRDAWQVLASLATTCAQRAKDFISYLASRLSLATQQG